MLGMILVAALAEAAAAPDSIIVRPDWVKQPTAEATAKFYPEKARMLGHSGRAVLRCKVKTDGTLEDCQVTQESPMGDGFGDAALHLSTSFQMKPLTIDGKPVGGGTIRIPVTFAAGGQLDPLSGTLKCYGRMAAMAEADPTNKDAWIGVRFWTLQSMGAAASLHLPPSSVEDELSVSRIAAATEKRPGQVKYETEECTAAMKRAIGN